MNAKEELIRAIKDETKIKCAHIAKNNFIKLKVGYSDEEYEKFLSNLDFEYDDGYGSQELFGTVWFEDGTWLERGEYDGSEWWEHKKCPKIPEELF